MTYEIIVTLLAILLFASVQADHRAGHIQEDFPPGGAQCISDASLLPRYAESTLKLGVDLYKKILQSGNQFQFVFSPEKISKAVALLELASGGSTMNEIHDQICPDIPIEKDLAVIRAAIDSMTGSVLLPENRQFDIYGANALYVDSSVDIDEDFKMTAMNCLKSLVTKVDFKNDTEKARIRINDWVSRRTNPKLNESKEIFPPGTLSNDASLVLVNAFGMLAEWLNPFTNGRIENGRFFINNKANGVQIPVMVLEDQYRYVNHPDMHVVGIDYLNKELTLFIFLSKGGGGLVRIEGKLGAEELGQLMDNAQYYQFELTLPKFEVSYLLPLKQYLQQMGVNEVFTDKADLSRLNNNESLFVTDAVHSSCFKVNENGTETAVLNNNATQPPRSGQYKVVIDHPFLFIVRHNPSKIPLLMGRINNPLQKEDGETLNQFTTLPPELPVTPVFESEPDQFHRRT